MTSSQVTFEVRGPSVPGNAIMPTTSFPFAIVELEKN